MLPLSLMSPLFANSNVAPVAADDAVEVSGPYAAVTPMRVDSVPIDITSADGVILMDTSTATVPSPPAEMLDKLTDDSLMTKWLVFNQTATVTIVNTEQYVVSSYALTSANDVPSRDPVSWTLEGSNDGTDWSVIDEQSGQAFTDRFQTVTYEITNDTAYFQHRFNFSSGNAATLQIAELAVTGVETLPTSLFTPNVASLSFEVYPNPVQDRLTIRDTDLTQSTVVRVISVTGRQLSTHRGDLSAGIDVSSLPSGTYFIQVENRGTFGVRKFFKR